jgi:hypothetical protein
LCVKSVIKEMPKGNKAKGKGGKKKQSQKNKAVSLTNNADLRPVRAPRTKTPRSRTTVSHVRSVCSVSDPFCPAAKNSKWPDGTMGNTLTEQFRGNYTIKPNADGNAFVVFAPTAPYGYNVATINPAPGPYVATLASGAAAWGLYKPSSMLATYGGNYRIVSSGFIARNVASATSAAGVVTFGTNTAPANGMTFDMGTESYVAVAVKAIQPGLEFSMISQPRGTGARDFEQQSTATAVPTDWSCLYVEITGATANVPCVNVEWYINVEFELYPDKRGLAGIAKPNPPKSSAAETAVSRVHGSVGSFIEGGVAQVEAAISKHASAALSSLMSDPLESLAALFSM